MAMAVGKRQTLGWLATAVALTGVAVAVGRAQDGRLQNDDPPPRMTGGETKDTAAAAAAKAPASQPTAAAKPPAPPPPAGPPAKVLFGAAGIPAALPAKAIGSYARGCLSGGVALPIDGSAWQAMRLSRNRNWGHPRLVSLVQKFAEEVQAKDGWSGLLVGDISQPRGGPMLTGHASHQIGLDADIWFTPMPDRRLSEKEREEISATSMLAEGGLTVDPAIFKEPHVRILKRAASYPDVERVLVHPAIKKALCTMTAGKPDRGWLSKVRPIWGHHYHFHIRIACPPGATGCAPQAAPPGDDGCGKEVDDWLKLIAKPPKLGPPGPPPRPITLSELPAECRTVLEAGKR
jgi:penicillin-insensitive murein endopeptidase